jgi:hypothetical protein
VSFGGRDKLVWFEVGKGQEETRTLPAAGRYTFYLQNRSGVMHKENTYELAAGAPFKQQITEENLTMTEMVVKVTDTGKLVVTSEVRNDPQPLFRSTKEYYELLRRMQEDK